MKRLKKWLFVHCKAIKKVSLMLFDKMAVTALPIEKLDLSRNVFADYENR